jgi:hypothetical protein
VVTRDCTLYENVDVFGLSRKAESADVRTLRQVTCECLRLQAVKVAGD